MAYQVVKHHHSGYVDFVTTGFSQYAPSLSPVERLGWRVFGRWMQARFYRGCGTRMRAQVRNLPADQWAATDSSNLRLAPSDAGPRLVDNLAVHRLHPG